MRQSRPLLPIRPLELPARLGRRRRKLASSFVFPSSAVALPVRARRKQLDLAVALAARAAWFKGPLFQQPTRSPSSFIDARHAA